MVTDCILCGSVMFSKKMREQLSIRYSLRIPLTTARKQEFLIWPSLVGVPLILFLPILVRSSRGLSLAPVLIFMALGVLWQLIFYLSHKITSFKKFQEMPIDEKHLCLLYDSFWHDLMRSGFGLYTFVALVWGLIEFGLGEGQITVLVILLLISAAFVGFCFIRREWIVEIAVDGLRKHKRVRDVIAVVMGFIAGLPLLGGIVRMTQVTIGHSGLVAIVPFFLFSGIILALAVFTMSFLGFMITYAHYCQWRKQQEKLNSPA